MRDPGQKAVGTSTFLDGEVAPGVLLRKVCFVLFCFVLFCFVLFCFVLNGYRFSRKQHSRKETLGLSREKVPKGGRVMKSTAGETFQV